MPIIVAPTGKKFLVIKIAACDKIKKHLENLGITVNSEIEVISRSGGNVICLIKDCRIALDSNLATKILIA
ncbi:MAG: FeoA family protein [Clostridia bacterium]